MLRRKATAQFNAWLLSSKQKALLVKGARQVGKTFLIESFAAERFENVVKFDMVAQADVRDSFAAASSADDLFMRMTVAADKPLVPGRTVVFIDEVQRCPNVVTFIKYLVQNEGYRYILSGSLLGVEVEAIDSLPVGYVTQVEMFPLDFEEYCWANGITEGVWSQTRDLLQAEEALPEYLYERFMGLFHQYLIVGGMPDAVSAFVATRNVDEVRQIQSDIRSLYRQDITKYAPVPLRLVIRDIFDLIPSEAGSKNRRFKLASIKNVKRFDRVTDHFLWLSSAGVALPVYNVSAPTTPLLAAAQRNLFKLFYLDVGILISAYPKAVAQSILGANQERDYSANLGAAYESFVAQELKAHGFNLWYFTSKKVGELDFLAEDAAGSIAAIEVKSGGEYKTHAALDNALATDGYDIAEAIVLAETNVQREGGILYLPIFAAAMLEYE